VAIGVFLSIPSVGEVFTLKDLARQITMTGIHSGIDNSNGNALPLRLSPNIFC
jgi:hypothetical protein